MDTMTENIKQKEEHKSHADIVLSANNKQTGENPFIVLLRPWRVKKEELYNKNNAGNWCIYKQQSTCPHIK